MPAPKKTPLDRAIAEIATPEVQQMVLRSVIAILQQAWQESAIEKGNSTENLAAESRVYGRCIGIAEGHLANVASSPVAHQIIRHVRPSEMPKTPTTEQE